jgi:hypothetical protein
MPLLLVQQISQPRPSTGSTGDAVSVLAVLVISVLLAATLLLVSDLRQRADAGATLVHEVERWLRDRYQDG